MPAKDTYKTIEAPSKGAFRDRGSKFLAFAHPVSTAEEAGNILDWIRREYHDASHYCFAWRLGPGGEQYRVNDDGEPSGSAGKPIYGQLLSHNLSNVLVVVVRYFGGTLLGVGGLINAYRSATADALEKARIIIAVETVAILLDYPYEKTREVVKLIDEEKLEIIKQEFTERCRAHIKVPGSRLEEVTERAEKIPGVQVFRT